MSTRPEDRRRRTARDPSAARRAAVAPPAPGDGPACARRAPERRRSHSSREAAPAPLDARLLPPALAAWAGAAWAVGLSGERAWLRVLAAALILSIAALPLGISARRFHPPRHRDDPRPGAGAPNGSAIGSARASLLLTVLVAVAVLVVATAGLWSRGADPLARAAGDGRAVALTGTVETEPRVVPGSRRTTRWSQPSPSPPSMDAPRARARSFWAAGSGSACPWEPPCACGRFSGPATRATRTPPS